MSSSTVFKNVISRGCINLTNLTSRQFIKKICVGAMAFMLSVAGANAQSPGPFFRQFAFNPYLYNAGYVGMSNNIEASVMYRQQWTGFKDSPVTAGASLQMPTSDRVALGFNVFTDKQVLLQNSNFMATFGYIVPIARNQSLRFGLSGGVGLNKLNLTAEELNTNDPTIARSAGTNYYIDGNFGAVYTYEGLKLGFALTDIFKSNAFNPESFNKFKMSNLRNRLFSASYKFSVGMTKNIALEPYALYRQTTDGHQDYWEVATIAYFKENIWSGLSYNQNRGLALIMGMNVKDKFRFSYSYEFPPFNSGMSSAGSHELHLGIRLASKRSKAYAKTTKTPRNLANEREQPSAVERQGLVLEDADQAQIDIAHPKRLLPGQTETENIPAPVVAGAPTTKTTPTSKPLAKPVTTTKAPKESFTMSPNRHYVVVGVFKVMTGSMKFVKSIREKGFHANVALNPKNNLYYVYIHSTFQIDDAKKVRNQYRFKNLFKESWIFTME
ncbi:MAG TPA: PorP/SprF family type IX secretion system membrane protein [Chryseolinea sp.]|nr:PorP/SprF family type IX secretion system membrane protein [Chryseolinea sp.]